MPMNNIFFIIIETICIFITLIILYKMFNKKRKDHQIEILLGYNKKEKMHLNLNIILLFIMIGFYFISIYIFFMLFVFYILNKIYIMLKKQHTLKIFEIALIDNLEQLSRLLSAGLSISNALEILAQNPNPIAQELDKVLKEITLGKDITTSFKESNSRYPIQSYHYFTTILTLQYETGASIREMLENLYNLLREKKKLAQKAKALSAEARFSIFLLGFLPIGLFLALWILNPNYIENFLNNPNASFILLLAFMFWGIGFFWMFKLTRFKHG